jgi:hypothetical protein
MEEFGTTNAVKSTIFWDITPCSPLSVNRSFGGTYRLHTQGRKIVSSARNQRESRWRYIPEDCILHNTAVRTSNLT